MSFSSPAVPALAVLSETLVDRLRALAAARPERRLFVFLDEDGREVATATAGELDRRARAVAAQLQEKAVPGDRALLLFPPGPGFLSAFLGCLYAGVVAVPAPAPGAGRRLERLRPLIADALPGLVLAPAGVIAGSGRRRLEALPGLAGASWLAPDDVPLEAADAFAPPALAGDDLAFLQYTSGSTSNPKGVMVTHDNLTFMEAELARAFGQDESSVVVGWLPVYHDMGLIGNLLVPLHLGAFCALMPPVSFLRRPRLWLETIARYRATVSGGPNFAYDLCVSRIPEAERQGLDLSSWRVAFNGAEPVRAGTLERFARAFTPCGFEAAAFQPCYGLAEATLLVAGERTGPGGPHAVTVETAALEAGRVELAGDARHGRALVGSGGMAAGVRVVVVDPETRQLRPSGEVGEIWVAGPGVARGYWRRLAESEETFSARTAGGEGPYLRTGDLGFVEGGELYITGRIKDLIILHGRNHYPQDLELTAEAAAPELGYSGAAFSVEVDGEERLVLACEMTSRRALSSEEVEATTRKLRCALAAEHEVQVFEILLLRPLTLPKTTSGKVQRQACRRLWLAGRLPALGRSRLGAGGEAAPILELDREALLALPQAERQRQIETWLTEAAARALHVLPGDIGGRPVLDLGFDSLAALELSREVEEALGLALPLSPIYEGEGIAALAERLAGALGHEAAPER